MFPTPQQAYKAGFALLDSHLVEEGVVFLRHVTEHGTTGTIYTVPDDALIFEVLVKSAGHGDLMGAPLAEVEEVATERRPLQ